MKRMLLFAVVALLPSCALSKNPLTDPDKAQVDRRLMGVWELIPIGGEQPREGEYAYVFIGKSNVTDAPAGLLELTAVANNSAGVVAVKKGLLFCTTSLNGKDYVSVTELPGSDSGKNPVWDQSKVQAYQISRYIINGNNLEIRIMNPDVLKAAIAKGELRGTVEKKGLLQMETIMLTASSAELCQFITAARDEELFLSKGSTELRRVK